MHYEDESFDRIETSLNRDLHCKWNLFSYYIDVTRNREYYYKFICIYSISNSYPNFFHNILFFTKEKIFIIASSQFKFSHETVSLLILIPSSFITQSKDSKLFQSRISDHHEKKHLHLSTESKLSFLLSCKYESIGRIFDISDLHSTR